MAIKSTLTNWLIPTQQPALILSPEKYARQYHDSFNNILRLYFSQIDNVTTNLLTQTGGGYLGFPHIAASDTTSQYATADNTPKVVAWDTLDSGAGFTLNNDGSATAARSGLYKIDYSLQFANTDSQIHEVFVWLAVKKSGTLVFTDLVGSASKFSVPNKHGSVDGYLVAYSSITFKIEAGDSVRLMWATNKAAIVSPATTGIYMEAYPAQTSPFAMPSIPSAIGTIAFVSNIPA